MKRVGLPKSKRFFAAFILASSIFSTIPLQPAAAVNDTQAVCQIGYSSLCPAQSPQEIYNLYGTTTNGAYWLNVNGVATQTYLALNTSYPDGGMWFLGMKGTSSSTNFNYSSTNWTSNTSTLNTGSVTDDVSTDAKFSAYNSLPITQLVAVFKDRGTYPFNATGSGVLGTNSFAGHTWQENLTSQTMYTRMTTNSDLYSSTGTLTRYDLYRETNSSTAKLVFAYQSGYAQYGFNYNNGNALYRWGIAFNNENVLGSIGSSDAQAGIGLLNYGAASVYSYADSYGYSINGSTGLNNGAAATNPSGFQLWGKMATPAMAAPSTLTRSTIGNGSIQLNIGSASGAAEYAVQYKLSTDAWSNSSTVRVINPSASPTAVLTGLASGTYDFRVWTRGTNNSSNTAVTLLSQSVDSTSPTVTSSTFSTSAGSDTTYAIGESVGVRLAFSETVTVSGSPRIPITGMAGKYFTYSTGSGTQNLDFTYTVTSGDSNTAGVGIAINTLELNGGTIKDLALNDAVLTHSALSPNSLHRIDGITPTVNSVTTSANGQNILITLSETQSSNALSGNLFAVTVNSLRDTVTAATQSGPRITLTLTFGIVSSDAVSLTYTDPSASNDTYALQDVAGNDVATFSMSVTNASTSISNTSISIDVDPTSTTAVYRQNNSIVATVSAQGRVEFRLQGKVLSGCRSVATTGSGPIRATCIWKPSLHNSVAITAIFKPSGVGLMNTTSEPLRLFVVKRSNTR